MRMKSLYSSIFLLVLAEFAHAQTETVVNAAGATVVEVVTQNAAGTPTTRILQTIVGSTATLNPLTTASTTTNSLLQQTTAATTSTRAQVGPVGQPGSTPVTPGGPTPYQYTTVDANGNTVVLQGVFSPTGPQAILPVPTTTGIILSYSQWLSMVGTYTQTPGSARRMSMPVETGWYYVVATAFAGLVGGAWLIVL